MRIIILLLFPIQLHAGLIGFFDVLFNCQGLQAEVVVFHEFEITTTNNGRPRGFVFSIEEARTDLVHFENLRYEGQFDATVTGFNPFIWEDEFPLGLLQSVTNVSFQQEDGSADPGCRFDVDAADPLSAGATGDLVLLEL